jgi:hypothetical protein
MNDQFKSVFSNIDKITESEFESNCKLSIKSKYQTMPDITITCEGIAVTPPSASGSVKFFVRVHFSKTFKGIHLKLGILVHYQKRNQLQQGR